MEPCEAAPDTGPEWRTFDMNPYGIDPFVRLVLAREHAVTLREEWGLANNTRVCRLSSFVEQFRRAIQPLDRARFHGTDSQRRRGFRTRSFSI